jgi:hypothetical protein
MYQENQKTTEKICYLLPPMKQLKLQIILLKNKGDWAISLISCFLARGNVVAELVDL